MTPGYGYTLATEKDGEEYFCPGSNDWHPSSDFRCHHKDCGKVWRKKVVVPDGWELVPEGELHLIPGNNEFRMCIQDGRNEPLSNCGWTIKRWLGCLEKVSAFIRRKPEPVKGAADFDTAWSAFEKSVNLQTSIHDVFAAGFKAGKESR